MSETQTASRAIIAAADALNVATDDQGRKIAWKKLSVLEDFDLAEIAGGENTQNGKWMLYATIAYSVRSIDGVPVPRPTNRKTLRGVIGQLGQGGIQAVFEQLIPPAAEEVSDEGSEGPASAERDRAKN